MEWHGCIGRSDQRCVDRQLNASARAYIPQQSLKRNTQEDGQPSPQLHLHVAAQARPVSCSACICQDLADHIAHGLVVYLGIDAHLLPPHFKPAAWPLLACPLHVDIELCSMHGTHQPLPDVAPYSLPASGRIPHPSLCKHSNPCIQMHTLFPVAADTSFMNMARAYMVQNASAQANML